MNRRGFLGMAAASIFVPQFGRFFREGSGRLWRPAGIEESARDEMNRLLKDYYRAIYPALLRPSPLLAQFQDLANAQYTGRQFVFGTELVR